MPSLWVPPYLAKSYEEFWVEEIPGPEHHRRIIEYHAATELKATEDEIAWCGSHCCWAMEPFHLSPRSARARHWLAWGLAIDNPLVGAICVLRRGTGPQPGPTVLDAPGHVAFFIGFSRDGKRVQLWGGNQSNRVCEASYPVEDVLGYRIPV